MRFVLYLFFMHVLNINIFLLTINVIILKDFLVNKLLNIHESGMGRVPHLWSLVDARYLIISFCLPRPRYRTDGFVWPVVN